MHTQLWSAYGPSLIRVLALITWSCACSNWVGPLAAAVYLPIFVGEKDPADSHMDLDEVISTVRLLFQR